MQDFPGHLFGGTSTNGCFWPWSNNEWIMCVIMFHVIFFALFCKDMIVDNVRSSYPNHSTVFLSYWFFKQTVNVKVKAKIMFTVFSRVLSTTCVVQTFQWRISKYLFIGFTKCCKCFQGGIEDKNQTDYRNKMFWYF